jgi:ribonuclease HI
MALKSILAKKNYYIFVDGGCIDNGKKNARAAFSVIFEKHHIFNTCKLLKNKPTNNRAELQAILHSFKIINNNQSEFKNHCITIVSDSMYSINCIDNWSQKWIINGFKASNGKIISNKDLVQDILNIKQKLQLNGLFITFQHINSHQAKPYNINSLEYKLWYYNYLVDLNIKQLLKTIT